jgi:hypothetical protein
MKWVCVATLASSACSSPTANEEARVRRIAQAASDPGTPTPDPVADPFEPPPSASDEHPPKYSSGGTGKFTKATPACGIDFPGWDFESGTLEGWQMAGDTTPNAFDDQPTYGSNVTAS